MTRARASPTTLPLNAMPCIFPTAAGLDIGSTEIIAALPPDRAPQPVRAFGTFTPDLYALADWLIEHGIDTVAMESTGVYWVPIYEVLERRGMTPSLVSSKHVRMVPGRKSEWNDGQWLQKLPMLGLLQGSFRPDAEICALRTLVRHRAELIQHRAPHILHMQNALTQMKLQLSLVLTDITGATGQAIIRALVAGERDPLKLAELRNPAWKATVEQIAKALTGTWQPEQLFLLKHALDLFDYYREKVSDCDEELERMLIAMASRGAPDAPLPALPPAKKTSKSKNKPNFTARAQMARIVGVDLVAVTGLAAAAVQTSSAEVGPDMSRFPTVKHFCSWLGVAPHNDVSGGKVLRSRTLKVRNRAGQAFRQAAQAVMRSDSACGAYDRAMRARLGPNQATVATAHTIARVVYHLLKHRVAFKAETADEYESKRRERELTRLTRRAQKLGYTLTPVPTDQLAQTA
jgi:transposase